MGWSRDLDLAPPQPSRMSSKRHPILSRVFFLTNLDAFRKSEALQMRRSWLHLVFFAILSLAAVLCVVMAVIWSNPQRRILPGGVELSLVAVTQGATNAYFPSGLFDKIIQRVFPGKSFGIGAGHASSVSSESRCPFCSRTEHQRSGFAPRGLSA